VENKALRRIRNSVLTLLILFSSFLAYARPGDRVASAPALRGPLVGHVIAVDPGHGGYDGGARAPSGQWEKVYNLSIARKVRDYLQSLGATVVMTRDDDYALCDINPPIRKKRQDMERRAEVVLGAKADLLVSIHMNQYRDQRQSGPQVFYRPDCEASKKLSQTLQASMIEQLSPRHKRAAHAGDFYILSLGIPSALIECGFLSNAAEEVLLRTEAYEERVAKAIGDGIVEWYALAARPVAAEREDR
jgi:N-acetylmuramoyl-L-alanine amidase